MTPSPHPFLFTKVKVTVSLQATFRGHRVTLKMMVFAKGQGRMAKARGGYGKESKGEKKGEREGAKRSEVFISEVKLTLSP